MHILAFVVLISSVYIFHHHFPLGHSLIKGENSFGENLTFLSYFSISFFYLGYFLKTRKNILLYSPLFLWFLITALEEISFGQSLFFKNTKLLQSINTQGELNLHNLKFIENIWGLDVIYYYFPLAYILFLFNHHKSLVIRNLKLLPFFILPFWDSIWPTEIEYFYGEMRELVFSMLYFFYIYNGYSKKRLLKCVLLVNIVVSLGLAQLLREGVVSVGSLKSFEHRRFTQDRTIAPVLRAQKIVDNERVTTKLRFFIQQKEISESDKKILSDLYESLIESDDLHEHLLATTTLKLLNQQTSFLELSKQIIARTSGKEDLPSILAQILATHNLGTKAEFTTIKERAKVLINKGNFSARKSRFMEENLKSIDRYQSVSPGHLILYIRDPFYRIR